MACQFRRRKNGGGRNMCRWREYHEPCWGDRERREAFSDPGRECRFAMHEERHVGAQLERVFEQAGAGELQLPESIEPQKYRCRVRAASTQTAAGGNEFVYADGDATPDLALLLD